MMERVVPSPERLKETAAGIWTILKGLGMAPRSSAQIEID